MEWGRFILFNWPKSLFGFFCKILWGKNLNESFGQPDTWGYKMLFFL